MPSVVRYIDNDGKVKVRDPNRVALVNRKGAAGVIIRKDDVDVSKLGIGDAGLVVFADAADGLGSGEGQYVWDGTYFRALMPGGATIACTAGESIIAASNRQAMVGATTLFLTAAAGLTVGTATTKPILPDGFHGQRVVLVNASSGANSITLTDVAGMAASNLKLIGATVVLAQHRALELVFDANATAGQRWRQTAPMSA